MSHPHLRWLAAREEDGREWFRIGREGDRLVAEWIGIGRLVASPDGSESRFDPEDGAPPLQVEKVRTGAAHALVERLRGKLALHASAIAIGDHAIVLVGASGAGKSTAAAELCANGASLLADDIAVLEKNTNEYFVEPTERLHWLSRGSRESLGVVVEDAVGDDDKAPARAPKVAANSVRLSAIVSLAFDDGAPRVTKLSGLALVGALFPSLVRFVVDDERAQRADTDAILALAEAVPAWSLTRSVDLRSLREAGRLLESLVTRKDALER